MVARKSLFILIFATFSVNAQDFVAVAPSHSKVILENAKVRVIEFRAKAGDKIPSHSHPPHIAYGLADGKAIFTLPGGGTRNAELKAGQGVYSESVTHSQEHITDAHVLIIELKQ